VFPWARVARRSPRRVGFYRLAVVSALPKVEHEIAKRFDRKTLCSGMKHALASGRGELLMLHYAWVFLVIAIIAGVLGFVGIAGMAASIAKVLFFVFLAIFVIGLIAGRRTVA
jgi:uncharacterized membrane protein YtjA (UPF0391 family)